MTEQAILTRDNDLSKTAETKQDIDGMVEGPNAHKINGMEWEDYDAGRKTPPRPDHNK